MSASAPPVGARTAGTGVLPCLQCQWRDRRCTPKFTERPGAVFELGACRACSSTKQKCSHVASRGRSTTVGSTDEDSPEREDQDDWGRKRKAEAIEVSLDKDEERLGVVRRRKKQAGNIAAEADKRKAEAERMVAEANDRVEEAQERMKEEKDRADEAEARASEAERRALKAEKKTRALARTAEDADKKVEKAEKRAEQAERRAELAERRAEQAEKRAEEAERKAKEQHEYANKVLELALKRPGF